MLAKKFILVGGYPHKAEDDGKAFCESLVRDFSEPVKVLVCLFARPKENWEQAFLQDKNFFAVNISSKKVEIKLATQENFIEELKWCDSIYFRGGDIDLVHIMSKFPGWENYLEGKVVAGSSMGAYMLSKYYFDITSNTIKTGTGITNTKVIVHWKSELPEYKNTRWEEGLNELKNYKNDLPIYKLVEGEFTELTQINPLFD